jgi:uncharacterized protein YndB with AHSA1/START domain
LKRYSLVTRWELDAPIERVWAALAEPTGWPRWWRYVEAVVVLDKGDAAGVGARRRFTWSSRLPYRLTFEMRTTRVAPPALLEGTASGELNGTGRWDLRALPGGTSAQYTWTVTPGKAWMNILAPVLSPVFAWNHDQVMHEGGRGLARHLGASLLGFSSSGR